MIEPTTSSPLVGAGTSALPSNALLGKDDFMKLLVTQLQNQDPLSPLQPHEFAAQLAQFASVEQLSQINDGMLYQLQSLEMVSTLSRTAFSAGLLGRSILAEGNQVTIPAQGKVKIQAKIGAGGGKATLKLLNAQGHEVAVRDLGTLPAGRQTLELPGDLPPGTYTYALSVKDAQGNPVPATTFMSGVVDRVLFEEGKILLEVGGLRIPLEALVEVASSPSQS